MPTEKPSQNTLMTHGVCTITQDISGCGIASINPFRYRGYYFDQEIGMYYLQSRYYDPSIGRFVNADEFFYMLEDKNYDLYAYCDNNPVSNSDPKGQCGIAGATSGGPFSEYILVFNHRQALEYTHLIRAQVRLMQHQSIVMDYIVEPVLGKGASKISELIGTAASLVNWQMVILDLIVNVGVGVLAKQILKHQDELLDIAYWIDDAVIDFSTVIEIDLLLGRYGREMIVKELGSGKVFFVKRITAIALKELYVIAENMGNFAYSRAVSSEYTYFSY